MAKNQETTPCLILITETTTAETYAEQIAREKFKIGLICAGHIGITHRIICKSVEDLLIKKKEHADYPVILDTTRLAELSPSKFLMDEIVEILEGTPSNMRKILSGTRPKNGPIKYPKRDQREREIIHTLRHFIEPS